MYPHAQTAAIREAFLTLAANYKRAVAETDRALSALANLLDLDEYGFGDATFDGTPSRSLSLSSPQANRAELSVVWKKRRCFLGNTLLFAFFERLARTPNRYVSHMDLLEDVWGGERQNATVRGVAKRLRDKLTKSGMADLAAAITADASGHYGLFLL